MAQFYEMPAVSPTMETGTIVAWKLAEGQKFESQAVVAEVGTDKANMDAEIFDAGVMIKHLIAEGDDVPAGFPIAIVGKSADEDISALLKEFEAKKAERAKGAKPAAKAEEASAEPPKAAAPDAPKDKEAAQAAAAAPPPDKPAPGPRQTLARDVGTAQREWMGKKLSTDALDPPGDIRFGLNPGKAAKIAASPLARAVAADKGVDLAKVKGSGPGGRIVRADVENAPAKSASAAVATRPDEAVKHSPMRKTIAKRLLQSTQGTPTFFLTVALDGAGIVGLREQLKARLPDVKVSVNDILVACVARALREFPKVNAAWGDDAITRFGRVDIGVAVAVPDGLITPVIRGADRLGFAEIGTRTRELAGRAREQKLKPEEYTGSTFTISNLGMYDISAFTAIINPPEAAILAVGSMAQVPVVVNGELAVGWRFNATMTCDHRVIDGATGAEFLQLVRKYIEAPALLLV
jgi:pyruvate dehydrogenase E2 component (dihydrolipoamide acetyltransferase)